MKTFKIRDTDCSIAQMTVAQLERAQKLQAELYAAQSHNDADELSRVSAEILEFMVRVIVDCLNRANSQSSLSIDALKERFTWNAIGMIWTELMKFSMPDDPGTVN